MIAKFIETDRSPCSHDPYIVLFTVTTSQFFPTRDNLEYVRHQAIIISSRERATITCPLVLHEELHCLCPNSFTGHLRLSTIARRLHNDGGKIQLL